LVEIDALVIAAQFGTPDDLRRFSDRIASWAAVQPTSRGRGFLAYLDACISHAAGDRAAAVDHALEAARLFAQSKHTLLQALALEFAGKLREALEIYRVIGSTRDASRVDAMLAGKGRRGRRTIDLTEREREVVQLVALGKPNKAIASALSISERTVENHVGSALKKFGAATRTELAAKVNLKEEMPRTGMTNS
jgi:DNA-binding NarL/FixJ family response regulator